MSSFKPDECTCELQSGQEVAGGLFVAGCDSSEVFDDVEKSFNEIALTIKREVACTLDFAIGFRWNNHLDAALLEAFDVAVGIIAFVAEQRTSLDLGS